LETAGVGGDLKFVKWTLNNRFYHKIFGDLIFRNSTEIGQMTSLGGRVLPPSQMFYLGGPNNMKGYQLYLLGPTGVNSQGSPMPLGGSNEAFSLFELEHPLVKEAGIKIVLFFDAGNTWVQWPTTLQTDAGFGIRWFSPIGPLRFEWGFPLNPRPGIDQPSVFQFFIGPPF
jgi:outer membrane protein insertion porin family